MFNLFSVDSTPSITPPPSTRPTYGTNDFISLIVLLIVLVVILAIAVLFMILKISNLKKEIKQLKSSIPDEKTQDYNSQQNSTKQN